ncbi:MAG: hypothetical protein ACR2QK_24510 [Acidimicrobiales bacterium]
MIEVGAAIPVVERAPDPVDLFSFSAAAWLLHRIHYDLPFTTEHDGHPGLLIHGPLQGTYMIQAVQWWLGPEAELASIFYRHSSPAYAGDRLTCGGTVTAVDTEANTFQAELWVRKPGGDGDGSTGPATTDSTEPITTTSGTAVFSIPEPARA